MNRGTTTTRRPIRLIAALITVGALALSACGSSGDDTASDTTAAGSSATTTAASADQPLGADCDQIDASSSTASTGKWELQTSSTPAMLTELETSLKNCEPIVVTLWHPHWAYAAYSIKDLKDPKGSMGKGEQIWTTANKKWAAESGNADLVDALKNFKLSDAELAGLEVYTANKFKDDPEKGAEEWLKEPENRKLADGWVEGLKGDGQSVDIGLIAWDEDIAATNLWKVLLEDAGFDVKVTELDAGPLFEGMAAGDLDFFFDTWLPTTHEDYWNKFGDKLDKVSQWFGGSATLNIAVPTYMNIDSLADLAKWGSDVDDKIIGIEPGAGLTRITQCAMMPDYDLAAKPDASICDAG